MGGRDMNLTPELIAVGVTFVIGVLSFFGGLVTAGRRAKADDAATAVNFANTLAQRLDKVEQRVEHLETELTLAQRLVQAATQYIDRLLWWHRTKRIAAMPRPPHVLLGHLDPEVLVEADPLPHPKEAADEAAS